MTLRRHDNIVNENCDWRDESSDDWENRQWLCRRDDMKKCAGLKESLLQSFFTWKLSVTKCKTFTGLSVRAKIGAGGRPLLPENLAERDPPCSKTPNSYQYLLKKPQP